MGDATQPRERRGRIRRPGEGDQAVDGPAPEQRLERAGTPWVDSALLPCIDGKARRVEPGVFPLAHGFPNRVGTLRGAGNAIVPEIAAAFVKAFMETRQ